MSRADVGLLPLLLAVGFLWASGVHGEARPGLCAVRHAGPGPLEALAMRSAGDGGPGSAAPESESSDAGPTPTVSRADTIVSVRPGDELRSETLRGTLLVRTHDDGEIRMSSPSDGGGPVLIREGRTLRIQEPRDEDEAVVVLEIPAWMPLTIRSRELDVSVSGVEAEVRIEVLDGDVRLERLSTTVDARTVDGEVDVRETSGTLQLFTADGDVRVVGHRGSLQVESTDGDLMLREVNGPVVQASTLDGDVDFDGVVGGAGSLDLSTHDGDVDVTLPASIQADVEVSTFDGGFTSDFRALTRGFRAGEPVRFRIGDGGARIALRSFSGDISIHSR